MPQKITAVIRETSSFSPSSIDDLNWTLGRQDWKTETNGFGTTFKITNSSSETLEVYWYDRNGEAKLYHKIPPSQSRLQPTFQEHPWYVKGNDGISEFSFYPKFSGELLVHGDRGKAAPFDFSIHSDGDFELVHLRGEAFTPEVTETIIYDKEFDSHFSNHYGYGIPSAAKALGVAKTATPLTEKATNNHAHLNLLDTHHAWAAGFTGEGVTVAVLDGGFHAHSELELAFEYDLNTKEKTVSAEDGYFHGNGTASAIAAKFEPEKTGRDITGIAPDVNLMAIDITATGGSAGITEFEQGILYAVDNGAKVIQISWGGTDETAPENVKAAVQYAYDNNVLVVFAAMNDSHYGMRGIARIAELGIAIAGGNLNEQTMQPFRSSNLPGDVKFPFFITPSGNNYVPSSGDEYIATVDGGTSYASPLISGIAALLYQQDPAITVDEVIKKLALSSWHPSIGRDAIINDVGQNVLGIENVENASSGKLIVDLLEIPELKADVGGGYLSRTDELELSGGEKISLENIERIHFTDSKIAFDTTGNAGDAIELLYAVSNTQYLESESVKGLAISLLDEAVDRNDVVDYVMNEVVGSEWGFYDMAELLATNVYNITLTTGHRNYLNDLREANLWDSYDFFWAIAESETVSEAINLVGLADIGITYS